MKTLMSLLAMGLLSMAVGCGNTQVPGTPSGVGGQQVASSEYVATSEPAGALAVGEARQSVKDNDAVTLVGLIGGSSEPFVEGLAAFTIVDAKVPYCAAAEGCPTPWDYCCESDAVKDNIATVKIVDAQGKPVASDARSLLNVKELSTVVVQGIAKRDDTGNLAVLADKVFVRK